MKNINRIIWGISLVVIGIIFGLARLEIIDIDLFFAGWWTLFIIVPCLIGLLRGKDIFGNLIGVLIGTTLLLLAQGVINAELISKLVVPAILVFIGLSLLLKNLINDKFSEEIKKLEENKGFGNKEYSATFSEQKIELEEADNLELTAVFGSVKCDLRNAKIDKDIVINTTSVFGGIDIFVPDNVIIKTKQIAILGGVENRAPKSDKETARVIYVNATCIFGGVDIK